MSRDCDRAMEVRARVQRVIAASWYFQRRFCRLPPWKQSTSRTGMDDREHERHDRDQCRDGDYGEYRRMLP